MGGIRVKVRFENEGDAELHAAVLGARAAVIAAALLFSTVVGSIAQQMSFGYSDYATYQDPILVLNSHGIPTSPLRSGLRELEVAPAYITSYSHFSKGEGQALDPRPQSRQFSDNEADGFGVVVSWLQGLSEHWGYSVSGTVARMSGKTFAFAEYDGADRLLRRHDANETGLALQAAALLIYDPFPGDNLRLPIYAGYGFLYQDQEAEYRASVPVLAGSPIVRYRGSFSALIPGAVFGASLQFNTGPLRWFPFLSIQVKNVDPSVDNVVVNEATGELLSSKTFENGDPALLSGGIGVRYRPWGVEFKWIPNLAVLTGGDEETDNTVYTISKTFRFGEQKDDR